MDWLEKKVARLVCYAFFVLTLGGVALLIFFPDGYMTSAQVEKESVRSFVIKTKGEHDLAIRIPPEVDSSKITIDSVEDSRSFTITIPGSNENDFYDYR